MFGASTEPASADALSLQLSPSAVPFPSPPQIAAFFAESLPSVGGQIIPPAGYFPEVAG